jgi:hypothetical protein
MTKLPCYELEELEELRHDRTILEAPDPRTRTAARMKLWFAQSSRLGEALGSQNLAYLILTSDITITCAVELGVFQCMNASQYGVCECPDTRNQK